MSAADLTLAQRDKITALLSDPLSFPPEFKNYLTDYLATNIPPIPVSQLLGYKGTLANESIVNTRENVTSAWAPERTWVDLPSYGPSITGLADGLYFAMYGYNEPGENLGGATVRVGISINGADPTQYLTSQHLDQGYGSWEARQLRVEGANDNNEIRLKYYYDLGGGADAEFQYRWLMALRIT